MYQAGEACYPTKAAANSALASSKVGGILGDGRVVNVGAVTDTSITYTYTSYGQGLLGPTVTTNTYTVQASPVPCQLLTFTDGISLAWKVVAVWFAAWALATIARIVMVEAEGRSDYGNT
ncbi:MAG: hypothetical protein PHI55_10015 [Burkholderiaceae bacterium]|nr:hypothetical protein [Burkholderiaceae bacterium]